MVSYKDTQQLSRQASSQVGDELQVYAGTSICVLEFHKQFSLGRVMLQDIFQTRPLAGQQVRLNRRAGRFQPRRSKHRAKVVRQEW